MATMRDECFRREFGRSGPEEGEWCVELRAYPDGTGKHLSVDYPGERKVAGDYGVSDDLFYVLLHMPYEAYAKSFMKVVEYQESIR